MEILTFPAGMQSAEILVEETIGQRIQFPQATNFKGEGDSWKENLDIKRDPKNKWHILKKKKSGRATLGYLGINADDQLPREVQQ